MTRKRQKPDLMYISPLGGRIITIVIAILFFVLLLLSSCSQRSRATRQLQKAERAIKRAEQLGAEVDSAIVWKTIEVPVPFVSVDTVFKSTRDTVTIEKERLTIKYKELPGDSVYIYGEAKADTIEVPVYHTVTRTIKAGRTDWELIILAIAVGAVCLLVGMFIQGRRK